MKMIVGLAMLAGRAVAEDTISASDADLSVELRYIRKEMRAENARLRDAIISLQQRINSLEAPREGTSAPASATGGQSGSELPSWPRRLQGPSTQSDGSTRTAVRAWQLHEFPAGQQCSAELSRAYIQPRTDSDFQLKRMGDTAAIDTFPAPFKVVHASDCASAPALNIALAVNMAGALTVGGTNLGTAVTALQAVQDVSGLVRIQIAGGVTDNRKYLSSASDGAMLDLWSADTSSQRQRWFIRPIPGSNYYSIKVLGGVTPDDRIFLSSSTDGSTIDLWGASTGCQHWGITPVSGFAGEFHIRSEPTCISGALAGGFLSAHIDGSAVNVYSQDDGSGRQRWTFN